MVLTLIHFTKKPVRKVFQTLSDMRKFAEVHPVIYAVEQLSLREYLFYERIKFLSVPFSFSYRATVEILAIDKSVYISSEVRKGVYLHI